MAPMNRNCCGEWTVKQGTIKVGIFTLLGTILWMAWQTYQLIWLQNRVEDVDGVCSPNPCIHGGICLLSDNPDNTLGYVCDCWGTAFDGVRCNASRTKTVSKRTCAEWWMEGHRDNGDYLIDPDGPDSGDEGVRFEPIVVECQFTANRAYTVFPVTVPDDDNDDSRFDVDELSATDFDGIIKFEYLSDALSVEDAHNYKLGKENGVENPAESAELIMLKVMEQSHHCEQRVMVGCTEFPLYFDESDGSQTNFTSVTMRDGTVLDWSGRAFQDLPWPGHRYMCQCYIDGSCNVEDNDDTARCNCNAEDNTDHNETLVLTKYEHEDQLPIQSIWIQLVTGSGTDAKFNYNITGLMCWDEFKTVEQYARWGNGGYGANGRPKYSEEMEEGFTILWGCTIAFIVVTALLFLAAILLLIGAIVGVGGLFIPWMIMMILMNIMVFIILIIRWYFLGFSIISWEVAVAFIWLGCTFYGMFAAVAFFGMLSSGVDMD